MITSFLKVLYDFCIVHQYYCKSDLISSQVWKVRWIFFEEQPPRGVLKESYSENMQQIYRRTPMRKCDFNKFPAYFLQNTFS